ncbi:MAG: hypothetical protein U0572_13425 [Phycisphaerales bacterium]
MPIARLGSRIASVGAVAIALVTVATFTSSSSGYERYNGGCQTCHGSFLSNVSPQGTVFPSGNKHTMHRNAAYMGTKCELCHTAGSYTNPFIGSSQGTANNPGVGCLGCHGANYGGAIGHSGAGLRKHHQANGVTVCLTCHSNDPTPLPESTKPTYYGTVDTKCDDPCNAGPGFKENWSVGDTVGLDNDGNNLYDQADPGCNPPCVGDLNGDHVVDASDLAVVLGAWGGSGAGDINGSGTVDASDIALMLGAFGSCP